MSGKVCGCEEVLVGIVVFDLNVPESFCIWHLRVFKFIKWDKSRAALRVFMAWEKVESTRWSCSQYVMPNKSWIIEYVHWRQNLFLWWCPRVLCRACKGAVTRNNSVGTSMILSVICLVGSGDIGESTWTSHVHRTSKMKWTVRPPTELAVHVCTVVRPL